MLEVPELDVFDGIVIATDAGLRFIDADQVQQITRSRIQTSLDDAQAAQLSPPGGPEQLPAFQFGLDGQPIPVVVTINRLLEAAADPWGVADWWLGRNAWLNGIPADLLGQVDDALLVLAARAEFPEA